jgi:hypothetical protein
LFLRALYLGSPNVELPEEPAISVKFARSPKHTGREHRLFLSVRFVVFAAN